MIGIILCHLAIVNKGIVMFYKNAYDCFPVKVFSVEQKYRHRKAWLTEGMKFSIKYKIKLHLKYNKEPSSFNENTYTLFQSSLNKIFRKSE